MILVGAELTKVDRPQAEENQNQNQDRRQKVGATNPTEIPYTYLGNCHDASCIYLTESRVGVPVSLLRAQARLFEWGSSSLFFPFPP